jgi:hypothetical protein
VGRLLRFRLSTLLLLTAIVAILLSWRHDRLRLQAEIFKLQHPDASWGVDQVTGPPNTTGFGDIRTAWASQTADGQQEWLELEFPQSATATAVWIYETYNPGAVVKVTRLGAFGQETVLWEGTDPTPPGAAGGISKIALPGGQSVGRLKIYLNSPAVGGWNEVDAVGLVDGKNRIQWATRAKASSSYGPNEMPGDFAYVW